MARERDEMGRFVKGHSVRPDNPGRKTKVAEVAYLELLKEQVGEEDWAQIVAQVKKIAKGQGDQYWEKLKPENILRAFVVLADRFLGKPTQPVDLGVSLPPDVKEVWQPEGE